MSAGLAIMTQLRQRRPQQNLKDAHVELLLVSGVSMKCRIAETPTQDRYLRAFDEKDKEMFIAMDQIAMAKFR